MAIPLVDVEHPDRSFLGSGETRVSPVMAPEESAATSVAYVALTGIKRQTPSLTVWGARIVSHILVPSGVALAVAFLVTPPGWVFGGAVVLGLVAGLMTLLLTVVLHCVAKALVGIEIFLENPNENMSTDLTIQQICTKKIKIGCPLDTIPILISNSKITEAEARGQLIVDLLRNTTIHLESKELRIPETLVAQDREKNPEAEQQIDKMVDSFFQTIEDNEKKRLQLIQITGQTVANACFRTLLQTVIDREIYMETMREMNSDGSRKPASLAWQIIKRKDGSYQGKAEQSIELREQINAEDKGWRISRKVIYEFDTGKNVVSLTLK